MANASSTDRVQAEFYRKALSVFTLLILLPCILSLINVTFAQNWKLHFFPAAIILAAIFLGPTGGVIAGISGSLYSAIFLGNPYIIAGNALFGLLVAIFYKNKFTLITSVLLAYLCELPWLILTDYYLASLPLDFIFRLVVVLLIANLMWASLLQAGIRHLRKIFEN